RRRFPAPGEGIFGVSPRDALRRAYMPFARAVRRCAALTLILCALPAAAQQNPASLKQLQAEIAAKPQGDAARALADRIRGIVGEEGLKNGTGRVRVEETLGLFALETDQGQPRVAQIGNIRGWELARIGETDVYAAVAAVPNFAVT